MPVLFGAASRSLPRESALEVPCDAEAREDAAESGRLEEDEHELECRVAGREVEARHVRDA